MFKILTSDILKGYIISYSLKLIRPQNVLKIVTILNAIDT